MATAWGLAGPERRGLALACAVLASIPDVDLIVPWILHRGPTHSVLAVSLVWAGAWMAARVRGLPAGRVGLACGLAYGSHLLLDWLGQDVGPPSGIMLFWPWNAEHYSSGLDLFFGISRRYWLPDQFIVGNTIAICREIVVLTPLAGLAWWAQRRR